jgi:hypothetical protein
MMSLDLERAIIRARRLGDELEPGDVVSAWTQAHLGPAWVQVGETLMRRSLCLWPVTDILDGALTSEWIVLDEHTAHGAWPLVSRWELLPTLGVQHGGVKPLELKNCPACGTTLAKEIDAMEIAI